MKSSLLRLLFTNWYEQTSFVDFTVQVCENVIYFQLKNRIWHHINFQRYSTISTTASQILNWPKYWNWDVKAVDLGCLFLMPGNQIPIKKDFFLKENAQRSCLYYPFVLEIHSIVDNLLIEAAFLYNKQDIWNLLVKHYYVGLLPPGK